VASEDSAREKKLCQESNGFNFVGVVNLEVFAAIAGVLPLDSQ
jgi:hypothetical protein